MSDGMVLALCIVMSSGAMIVMFGLVSIGSAIRHLADSLASPTGKEGK